MHAILFGMIKGFVKANKDKIKTKIVSRNNRSFLVIEIDVTGKEEQVKKILGEIYA